MIPQGSTVYPTQKIDAAIDQINAVQSPVELQSVVDQSFLPIKSQLATINEQLALLAPIQALMSLSLSDLPSVITFIGDLKTALLGPIVQPYITYPLQITQITSQVARLIAAVEAAESRIGASVTIPTIP